MTEPVDILIRLRGERAFTSGADRAAAGMGKLDRATERASGSARIATRVNQKFHAGLSAVGRAARVGASVGVGALTAEAIKATKGWSEHVAIMRRSAAVIRSTGGAAGVTAGHVEGLSDKIERQTGVDGDLVQSGANLLLTFTNVRNGVGKNNQVFDKATGTVANMSKALGQDTKSSAIQLGKALNDPTKGITALSRVGVSFTAGQKKTIGALVESGQKMKAQKIILKELGKEFPKVKATPFEKLQIEVRKLEDALGKALLPTFNQGVRILTRFLRQMNAGTGAGGKFAAFLQRAKVEAQNAWPRVKAFVAGIDFKKGAKSAQDLSAKLTPVWHAVKKLAGNEGVQKAALGVGALVLAMAALNKASGGGAVAIVKATTASFGLASSVVSLVANIVAYRTASLMSAGAENTATAAKTRGRIATVLSGAAQKASAAATWLWTAATKALNFAMRMNPIGLVITAIVLLVAGVILAYKKFGWFRNAVNAVWSLFKKTPIGFVISHFKELIKFASTLPGRMSKAVSGMWDGIKHAFKSAINWVIRKWNNLSFGMSAKKVAGHTVIPGFHVGTPDIPLMAKGGNVTSPGASIVGERGPELLTLPKAARVDPLTNAGGVLDPPRSTVVTKVYLDRRQIAEAVGTYAADRKARR